MQRAASASNIRLTKEKMFGIMRMENDNNYKEEKMKILFVGNSYTFFNDMPALFAELCKENGVDVQVDSVTRGGYSFAHYVSEENEKGIELRTKLAENSYDYIILQEQSVRPAESPETFLDGARRLCDMVRENGAKPVFYQTWGRREDNKTLSDHGWTRDEMHAMLKASYVRAAEENDAQLVYAGDAFDAAYRAGEAVYHNDGTHPSAVGSAVIARAFYDALFGGK